MVLQFGGRIGILGLGLLGTSLLFGPSVPAVAEEAICFVQPAGAVPIPCPTDANNNPIVSTSSSANTTTDSSGGIVAGGTFQQIAAASGTRKSLELGNTCQIAGNCVATTDVCYFYFGSSSNSKSTSIVLYPGQYYLRSEGSIPNDQINATCDGTGDTYYLKVQ